MIISRFENRDLWMQARQGKITGSRLKDILVKRGTGKKKGFFELIAERLAIPRDDENVMARGHRLEEEALDRFTALTGKEVNRDLMIWMREDNESIAVSPDGTVSEKEACEAKCLSSASHIEAYIYKTFPGYEANPIPSEYREQGLQYFCVNDALETLNFCFYDPSFGDLDCAFFVVEMHRKDYLVEIAKALEDQRIALAEVNAIVNKLSGF